MSPRFYRPGNLIIGNLPSSIFHNIVGMVIEVRTDCETDLFDFGSAHAMLPPYAVRPMTIGVRIDTRHDS